MGVHLHNDLSVLRQDDVLQCAFHQQGEVHLIHSHVRQSRLLHREKEAIMSGSEMDLDSCDHPEQNKL